MNGGPFKLPTKENADAAKKKRVRRGCAPRTSRRPNPSPLLIESHLTSTPFPVHHSRRRSPGSRSGSSLASRISTSRIARVSSTSRRCAPRYPLSSVPRVDDTTRPSRRGPFDRNATTDRKSSHPHHPRPRSLTVHTHTQASTSSPNRTIASPSFSSPTTTCLTSWWSHSQSLHWWAPSSTPTWPRFGF